VIAIFQRWYAGTAFWGFHRNKRSSLEASIALATLHFTAIENTRFIHFIISFLSFSSHILICHINMYNRFYIKTCLKQSAINAVIVYRGIMLLKMRKSYKHTLWNCYFKCTDVKTILFFSFL